MVLGMVENMLIYICSNCGYEEYIFGYGGVVVEVEKLGVFLLGVLLIDLEIWFVGDSGMLIVVKEGLMVDVYVCIV